MVGGKIIACASEERFSRLKNDTGYPKKAIDYCLAEAELNPADLDKVVFSSTDLELWWNGIRNEAKFSVQDHVFEQYNYYKKILIDKDPADAVALEYIQEIIKRKGMKDKYYKIADIDYKDLLDKEKTQRIRKQTVIEHLGIDENKIKFIDHHACHAAHAYFSSNKEFRTENTLIMTMDSSGDRGINATLSIAGPDGIKKIFETTNCQWGRIYKYVTLLLGMKLHEHEYKVMGLAPYGNIKEIEKSYPVFDDVLKVNGLEFEWNKKPGDLYFHFRDKLEGHRFDGIAGALQKKLEESIGEWLKNAVKETGVKKIVFGGGLAMNIKLGLYLSKIDNIEKIFVGPSPADESNAIGACCYAYYEFCREKGSRYQEVYSMDNSYLGPEFNYKKLIELIKRDYDDKYEIIENFNDEAVARLLTEGKIVARCIGRMEFGARALGNRSILADPSRTDIVKKINKAIKHRDFWMPFASSIMQEHTADYLLNEKELTSDYMTMGFETKELAHRHLIAALHPEDLTSRPQIVRPEQNPEYHNLLNEFYKLSGIGGILNTSLNLHGHPIVCFPEDLIMVMENSDLEYAYVKNHLIKKNNVQ